jgi:hypothetical protein
MLHHDNAPSHSSSFTREIFNNNSPDLAPCDVSQSPRLKDRHSDTTEVIEAESQAAMNTLTKHDFQDAFKKRQKRWGRCIRAEGDYSDDDVASRPKYSF